jgi:hypothetical protein
VIVVAAAVTLGLSVHHELQTTAAFLRPGSVNSAAVAYRQEECIYRAIRSELPKGAAVYIDDPVHVQRLAELSTLWAVPQPTPATARWTISLVRGFHLPGDCFGLVLEVRRR